MDHVNPTAELIAKYLYDLFINEYPKIVAIHVSETPKTWAVYRR